MRLVVEADNEREQSLARETREMLGVLMETVHAPFLAHAFQAGIRLGLFVALDRGERTAAEVAAECHTGVRATAAVLEVLATTEFVARAGDRYALTELGRKWLVPGNSPCPTEVFLLGLLEWGWHRHLLEFLRTGVAIDIHARMTPEHWRIYEDAMYFGTQVFLPVLDVPVPDGPVVILDLASGHGLLAADLCRRHPQARAVVFDLPGALEASADRIAALTRELGGRLRCEAGDAFNYNFGESQYDLIVCRNLLHVASERQDAELMKRCARALKPGGTLMMVDPQAQQNRSEDGENKGFFHLLMGLICQSGFWTREEITKWIHDAGLEVVRSSTLPGPVISLVARKPARSVATP